MGGGPRLAGRDTLYLQEGTIVKFTRELTKVGNQTWSMGETRLLNFMEKTFPITTACDPAGRDPGPIAKSVCGYPQRNLGSMAR